MPCPSSLSLPLLFWRWRQIAAGRLVAPGAGLRRRLGLVLYSVSMLYTDIVRAMLLFYLTPLWSTLLARLFLGEADHASCAGSPWASPSSACSSSSASMRALPLPRNVGRLARARLGLSCGRSPSIMLRADKGTHPVDLFTLNFIWSAVLGAAALVLIAQARFSPSPPLDLYLRSCPGSSPSSSSW